MNNDKKVISKDSKCSSCPYKNRIDKNKWVYMMPSCMKDNKQQN